MLPFGMPPVNDDNRPLTPDNKSPLGESVPAPQNRPQYWLATVKLLLPVLILGYLVRHISLSHPEAMRELWYRPKSTPGLLTATAIILFAVMISFVRWYVLVSALKLPFPITSAIRLGFIGYFMNFVSAGGVGGDVFKAALMVREIKSRRSAALATIFLDRFLGLYALGLLACIVTLAPGTHSRGELGRFVRMLPLVTALLTLGGFAGLIALGSDNWLSRAIRRIPWASSIIHDLLVTAHAYRSKKFACLIALCLSLLVHFLSATGHYVLAQSFGTKLIGSA
ncbi:MAG: lysylphosphatidylglycerol synthase transmembrane domain-containing protein [Planctomycetota bacterium]|nr:lysylphosphatidylglycerol synthase transmembrane domain-containing protein [Planctomycetota bacterium]